MSGSLTRQLRVDSSVERTRLHWRLELSLKQTCRSVPSVKSAAFAGSLAGSQCNCTRSVCGGLACQAATGEQLGCTQPPALASSGSLCTDWSGARNTRVTGAVLHLERRSLALRCLAPSVASFRVRRARVPGSYGWTTRLHTPPALASRARTRRALAVAAPSRSMHSRW